MISSSFLTNDEALTRVFTKLTSSAERKAFSLVCRRWLRLYGLATRSLRLYDWSLLESGRLARRFPNLTHLDLTGAWSNSPDPEAFGGLAIYMTRGGCAMRLDPQAADPFHPRHKIESQTPEVQSFDSGLRALVSSYPSLRSLHVVDVFRPRERTFLRRRAPASLSLSDLAAVTQSLQLEDGAALPRVGAGSDRSGSSSTASSSGSASGATSPLRPRDSFEESVDRVPQGLEIAADGLPLLQELTIRQCMDSSLAALARASSRCPHLQTVRLVGALEGFYHAAFTDKGLRRLPRSCPRILELHLTHADVGLEGLAAVAQGCPMLSELHLGGKTFASDWLQALCLFPNLRALHLRDFAQANAQLCGSIGHGSCPSLRDMHLQHCDLRSREFLGAILRICRNTSTVHVASCRGFSDQSLAAISQHCRNLTSLELVDCPLVTTRGLEASILQWKDLQLLSVIRCMLVRDEEISQPLADVIFALKELKWKPLAPRVPQQRQLPKRHGSGNLQRFPSIGPPH